MRLRVQQVERMEQYIVKVHCVRIFEPLVVMFEDQVKFPELLD